MTAIYDGLGIALYDSEGQLRSSYEILGDLSKQWDNLSQNEKNYIALTSAGSNQLNAFLALMENFGHATDATNVALNSAGSAIRENSRFMDSLEAKVQSIRSAFQEFANNVLSSELVSAILTAGKAILDFANTDLGQFISKLLLANLAIQAGAGLWANFGNLIMGIINPFSGLTTAIQGATTIFGTLRGVFMGVSEGFQIVASGAGTLGEVFTELGSGAMTFGGILASINPIFAAVAVAAIAAAAAYRHFHVSAEEQAQTVSDLFSKVSQLKSEYENLASSDSLTAADQERLDILQKQIEANEILLAQEAQKSYQLSYGDKSKHNVEVTDEQRDANVQQYNKLTDEINKQSEALNQLQQSYDTVVASQGTESQAAKDIQDQMMQTQQRIVDLKQEQESFAVSDAGTLQLTGLEEIENKMETLKHLKESIADNKAEMEGLDATTAEGANKINELAAKNAELESSYNELNGEVANDVQSLKELGDTMGGLPDDAQAVIDAWLDFNDAQEKAEKSAENLEKRIRKIADVEIKPKDADSMGEWLESLGDVDLEHLEYLLTEVGNQAEWFSAQLAGMTGDEAVSYINEVFQRLSGSIRDAGEAYSKFEAALETDYSEPLKQVYEMMDYITQSTQNGITNLQAYNASLQGIYGTTDKNIIKIAEQNAAISDFRNVSQEAAEGQATLAGNIEQYFQNGVFQGDLLIKRLKELGTSATAIAKYGDLLDFKEFDDGTFEIAINDFSKLSEVLGLTDPVLKSFMNSMAGTVDFQLGESIDAVTNAIQRLHEEVSKTGTGEISNIANEVRAMGDNINNSDLGVKRLGELQDKLNALSQYTNVSFDYDFEKLAETGDLKGAADEITAYAAALQNLTTEAGDWDIQGLVDSVNEGLSEGQGIEIDGDSIKFNSDEAVDAFKQQLSDAFGGMSFDDIVDSNMGQTIISNLFEGLEVDTSAAEGVGQKLSDAIKTSVQEKLNTTQLTINGVGAEVASDMGIAVQGMNDYSESVKNAKSDTEDLNNVSLSKAQSEVKKVGTSAQTADSQVRTLWNDIQKLNTTVTTKFVSDTTGYKPPTTPTGSTVTVKGEKANGQIPAYANGLQGTMPMRAQYSGMSLVGEEGAEFKISKDGKKELVGQDGAELVKVDKGDTIIPADATAMIRSGQLNGYDGGLRGRTSATGSGVANASHNISIGEVKSRYSGNTITSISKATSATTSNTKATASNTSAKTANASANSSAASATDELTDAQKKQQEVFQEANDVTEHHIFLREKQGASYEELIKMNRDYQKQLNEQANWWRSQGFDDDSEEIRKIQKSWKHPTTYIL